MNPTSNPHPLDELAVYAVHALDPDESLAVEAHLAGCPACRAELDRHLDTLAQITPPEAPPDDLWDRIASQLPPAPAEAAEPAGPVPLDAERRRRGRRGGNGARPQLGPWLAAAAAVAMLVVGVGLWTGRGADQPDVGDLAQQALDDPDAQIVQLSTASGDPRARVVLTPEGTGYVLLDEMPTLPSGRSYQLWKVNGGAAPVSLGVIGDGSAEAAVFALPADSSAFAISEEPDGGAPTPTGPIVADGELS